MAKRVTAIDQQVYFVWVGNGPLFDECKAATEGNERILFNGAVTDPARFLKQATIYYQPSLSETQGIAVAEAMYHYLPCVVSDTGGLPETVRHGYNGVVVDPINVNAHVSALSTLLNDASTRDEYGVNSHKRGIRTVHF